MKAIAINGSPRKEWNTAALLRKSLEGAASAGAKTELIHLSDLNFKGCCSCFYCKRKSATGQCAMRDDLTETMNKIMDSDILLLGCPIYLGNITGTMKSFMERMIFPHLSYDSPDRTDFSGRIQTGFIYTMGLPHNMVDSSGYQYLFENNKSYLQLLNGQSEYLISADNYQFDNYSNYAASNFDEMHKAFVKKERFPIECQEAYDMGKKYLLPPGISS